MILNEGDTKLYVSTASHKSFDNHIRYQIKNNANTIIIKYDFYFQVFMNKISILFILGL